MKPPQKRYLTGIDWAINTLDYRARKTTGHGNSSQIILFLKDRLDAERLRPLLARTTAEMPVLQGRVARAWNLCPYWKIDSSSDSKLLLTEETRTGISRDEIVDCFQTKVNQKFTGRREHLRFHLLHVDGGRSCLAMHFDHRLLDAYGAELFLELLTRTAAGEDAGLRDKIKLVEPPSLGDWRRRFKAGQKVNRLRLALAGQETAAISLSSGRKPRFSRFQVATMAGEESARIVDNAYRQAGYLMLLPYLLACALESFDRLFRARNLAVGDYVVPVSVVRRSPETLWEDLFFNRLSFVFFQIPSRLAAAGNRDELIAALRSQLYTHLKNRLPEDFCHAAMLTRIAPLPIMNRLADIPLRGKVGSFYFSCLKESGLTSRRFLGAEIDNLLHTPHMPMPPGLGLACNLFQDKINITLSAAQGIMERSEERMLLDDLTGRLTGNLAWPDSSSTV